MDSIASMTTCACKTANSAPASETDLESLLSGLGVISPYAATIAGIDDNANDAIPRLTVAIANDPKLTARVLGLANSTAFSPGRPIESIRQAVMGLARNDEGKLRGNDRFRRNARQNFGVRPAWRVDSCNVGGGRRAGHR